MSHYIARIAFADHDTGGMDYLHIPDPYDGRHTHWSTRHRGEAITFSTLAEANKVLGELQPHPQMPEWQLVRVIT